MSELRRGAIRQSMWLGALIALPACAVIPQPSGPAYAAAPKPLFVQQPIRVAKASPRLRAIARAIPLAEPDPVVQPLPEVKQAPAGLEDAIRALGSRFQGKVGIAVRDVEEDWLVHHEGRKAYPQQSVSKFWVAVAMLDAIDRGAARLDDPVTITADDLTLFNQPISQFVDADGYRTTIRSLLEAAMTKSDNTANDVLLREAGGPAAVRRKIERAGIDGVKFGPGERLLQAKTAGLTWRQEMSRGLAFQTARAKLPLSARQEALNDYLDSPPDGASPAGITQGLAKLRRGELLSPASTEYLIGAMARSKTGPKRLKGGLAPGWGFAHKTGTGQQLGARSTGYNDVAILTAPDGTSYAVAVLIGETTRPIPERMSLMQAVTRAVIAAHYRR